MERRYQARLDELLDDAEIRPGLLRGLLPRLETFLEPFVRSLCCCEQRTNAHHYVSGLLSDLQSQAGVSFRLRTTDDDRARQVCAAEPEIEVVDDDPDGGLLFKAPGEDAVAALSQALAESGTPVVELTPRRATLEDLFFQLTEGEAATSVPTPEPNLIESAA